MTPLRIEALPPSYTIGDHDRFSFDSAWWVFNMVSNLTYDRWSRLTRGLSLGISQQNQSDMENSHE